MKRSIFYYDGFNVYHSLRKFRDPQLKWLDLWKLSNMLLPKHTEKLETVKYFSAVATHRSKASISRHNEYINALKHQNCEVILGQFKEKKKHCKCDGEPKTEIGHIEKETDVNLALSIVVDAFQNRYDKAYIVTGDTDIAPALSVVKDFFPEKEIISVRPPNKKHPNELIAKSNARLKISKDHIVKCLFPKQIFDAQGNVIATCPTEWSEIKEVVVENNRIDTILSE